MWISAFVCFTCISQLIVNWNQPLTFKIVLHIYIIEVDPSVGQFDFLFELQLLPVSSQLPSLHSCLSSFDEINNSEVTNLLSSTDATNTITLALNQFPRPKDRGLYRSLDVPQYWADLRIMFTKSVCWIFSPVAIDVTGKNCPCLPFNKYVLNIFI